MTDIYETHAKAFAQVAAYVVLHEGERVATVAFKFPRDGAGRVTVFVHWIGAEMVKGTASGYGYDKRSAAASDAARKLSKAFATMEAERAEWSGYDPAKGRAEREAFRAALAEDTGKRWDDRLTDAGFTVLQAV